MTRSTVNIYPVGILFDLKQAKAAIRGGRWDLAIRHIKHIYKSRNRNALNGYLAEIDYPPESLWHLTCGHGWTKRRAARKLGEYLARDNSEESR